jgi:hypothetical protein
MSIYTIVSDTFLSSLYGAELLMFGKLLMPDLIYNSLCGSASVQRCLLSTRWLVGGGSHRSSGKLRCKETKHCVLASTQALLPGVCQLLWPTSDIPQNIVSPVYVLSFEGCFLLLLPLLPAQYST